MKHFTTFVGLDVHKDTIDIALAESGDDKESAIMEKSTETLRH